MKIKIGNKKPLSIQGTVILTAPVIIIIIIIIIIMTGPFYSYAQAPFLQLSVDGPDMDNQYSIEESIHLGELDHLGDIRLEGDFPGVKSRPLGSADFSSDDFKGVIYEFSPLTGGNNEFSHPNAGLAVKITGPANWQLSISAYVNGDPGVSVDQLMFKEDNQKEYTPFTPSPQIIYRGNPGTYHLFYDLALRIDRTDRPGKYLWQITYMLVAY